MIKRFFLYFSILLFFLACENGPEKPKNLISKKDMVNILIDAKLLKSAGNVNKDVLEKRGLKFDSYVFKKYGIDSLKFAESNTYYTYHLKEYEEIYTAVADSLEALKTILNKQKEKEEKEKAKREKDSINNLKKKDSLVTKKKESVVKKVLKKSLLKSREALINSASSTNRQPQE